MKKEFIFFLLLIIAIISSQEVLSQSCENNDVRNCPLKGICATGTQVCLGGSWSSCDVSPQEEVCDDGLDNDCDGVTDENCVCIEGETRSCGPNLGICKDNRGTETCTDGAWSDCTGGVVPINETGREKCSNNIDEDCDGLTDLDDPGCVIINTCNDGTKNFDETGIDCGGSCPACVDSCSNGIKDGNETGTDCGGSCNPCPTCSDGIQNQNEEDIDCGGPCTPCIAPPLDSDSDGLTDTIELEKGTDPNDSDSDDDGAPDGSDSYPLCPNDSCDTDYDEDPENCPEDCRAKFPLFIMLFPFIALILLLLIYYLIKRSKKKKGKKPPRLHPYFIHQSPRKTYSDAVAEELKKIK